MKSALVALVLVAAVSAFPAGAAFDCGPGQPTRDRIRRIRSRRATEQVAGKLIEHDYGGKQRVWRTETVIRLLRQPLVQRKEAIVDLCIDGVVLLPPLRRDSCSNQKRRTSSTHAGSVTSD